MLLDSIWPDVPPRSKRPVPCAAILAWKGWRGNVPLVPQGDTALLGGKSRQVVRQEHPWELGQEPGWRWQPPSRAGLSSAGSSWRREPFQRHDSPGPRPRAVAAPGPPTAKAGGSGASSVPWLLGATQRCVPAALRGLLLCQRHRSRPSQPGCPPWAVGRVLEPPCQPRLLRAGRGLLLVPGEQLLRPLPGTRRPSRAMAG